MKETILETQRLTRRFGSLTAVEEINFVVHRGDVFGLIGPNGAGKTTTMKMLTTLLSPTSGTAIVAGWDVVHFPANVRRTIGYVPQLLSADGSLTGYENLLLFAKLYDLPASEREERIHHAIEFMELSDAKDKLVRSYSGGMIRRLEIAQAVLHNPPVLFLDEPTVGLDPVARQSVWKQVEALAGNGTTIILTTHYMEEADNLCTRIAIMHQGKLVANGSPAELKKTVPKGFSISGNGGSLDDVFAFYSGGTLESEGGYREASRVRRTARRLS